MTKNAQTRAGRLLTMLAVLALTGATAMAAGDYSLLVETGHTMTGYDFLAIPAGFAPATEYTVSTVQPVIDVVHIPRQPYPGNVWSHWGRGLIASNGKYYMGYGDHLGLDAEGYIYEYDPATKVIHAATSLWDPFQPFPGDLPSNYGYGKIHGRISEGLDGCLYFASYWGAWKTDSQWFYGDRMFKYDPATDVITDLGMPKLGWGYPSVHFYAPLGLMYIEAFERKGCAWGDPNNGYVSPSYTSYNDPYIVRFMVYDVNTQQIVYFGDHENFADGRDVMVDAQGRCYFGNGMRDDGEGNQVPWFRVYDPVTNTTSDAPFVPPGQKIRRSDGPFASGKLYASTGDTLKIFSWDPATNEVRVICDTWGDPSSLIVDPTETYAYYVPGSHGSIKGVPIVQVDLATGNQKVIAFMEQALIDDMGIYAGGSLNFVLSPDGQTLYANLHGGYSASSRWEEEVLLVIQIPQEGGCSFLGDANRDGSVDIGDLGILGANYGNTGMTWVQGDFNGDGVVDVGDLGILGANYGWCSPNAPGGGNTAVPEPAALSLLAIGGLAVLRRKRKA